MGSLLATVMSGLIASACAVPAEQEEEQGVSHEELKCNAATATRLATIAKSVDGKKSQKRCYRFVKEHLRGAGISTADPVRHGLGGSAYQFAVWAKQFPNELAKAGLKKITAPLTELPRGAIIVWPRGMCGYSSVHGHIEIVVDDRSSRACSDFCGRVKTNCGTPDIFVPKGCGAQPADEDTAADEGEDDPDAERAKPGAANPVDEEDPAGDEEVAGCWSATLQTSMAEGACVQSKSTELWYQCRAGKWYQGVSGTTGPYGKCVSRHAL